MGAVVDLRHAVPFCRDAARKRHERCGCHPTREAWGTATIGSDAAVGAAVSVAPAVQRDLGVFSTMPSVQAPAQPDLGTPRTRFIRAGAPTHHPRIRVRTAATVG